MALDALWSSSSCLAQIGSTGTRQLPACGVMKGISGVASQTRHCRSIEARAAPSVAPDTGLGRRVLKETWRTLVDALSFVQNEFKKAACAISATLSFAMAARSVARHARMVGIYIESQQALARAASMIPELARLAA